MIDLKLYKKLAGAEGDFVLDVALHIPAHSILGIMGPSGAGKTSILKMIAGLLTPEQGEITVNGKTWYHAGQSVYTKPQHRSVGYVFQDYSLFPNMSLRENLLFALGKDRNQQIVDEILDMMGLQALEHRKPDRISGGQRQRVALARAIVRHPEILLLDEPFAALDKTMRYRLQEDLKLLHQKFNTTTILVSHDPAEIVRLAQNLAVIERGKIIAMGRPSQLLTTLKSDVFEGEVMYIDTDNNEIIATSGHFIQAFPRQAATTALQPGDQIRVSADGLIVRKKE